MSMGRDADFHDALGCLVADASARLATQLQRIGGLAQGERQVIHDSVRDAALATLHGRTCRLLLLELHAAVEENRLAATDSHARWHEFVALASTRDFWTGLEAHYPGLWDRLQALIEGRFQAGHELARRFARDRSVLGEWSDAPLGELLALEIGAGDSHLGGKTVAVLRCAGARVVYKPRPVGVDVELKRFIEGLGIDTSMRVPAAIERDGYGWTAFVAHRHADDADGLRAFYRGIGEWLATMRLLGGTDLHAENLIAHGRHPVVIDCETLFTPKVDAAPSGLGEAHDRAAAMVDGSVLNMGLLPGRGGALAWRGVDTSGIGALPGEQPKVAVPAIVDAGTDRAHLGTRWVDIAPGHNHPSDRPELTTYWPDVLGGFDALTMQLRALDARGELAGRLRAFDRCDVRVVVRATETYAELARMLWHPVSLHDPRKAWSHAAELLRKAGEVRALAPDDDGVIAAEIADLVDGDIPYFGMRVSQGTLRGPRGTRWLAPCQRVDEALAHWRRADVALERMVIHGALASAYADEGQDAAEVSLRVHAPRTNDLDVRRRTQAASIMRLLATRALRCGDGSVAWIASVLGPTGRSVQPVAQDLYGGLAGLALVATGYAAEQRAGRADVVDGIVGLRDAIVTTMRMADDESHVRRLRVARPRPTPPGAYIGLGAQIGAWLSLEEAGVAHGEGIARATRLASLMPESLAADEIHDVLTGAAGGIVPLLRLHRATDDPLFVGMARALGDRLCDAARMVDGRACWTHARWPDGLGGFAHGATGIGWALAKLAEATGEDRYETMARAAMAFEDALFDGERGHWRDRRDLGGEPSAAAWCHGSVGIGLAWIDLGQTHGPRRERLRAAVADAWARGIGANHGLCHGDFGAWELLARALDDGLAPERMTRALIDAALVASLERHGPRCGRVGEALSPGLMTGLAGVVYQLLRMDRRCDLPSVMIPSGRWSGQSSTRSTHSDNVPSTPPMAVAASTSLG
ncbi:type 2 lanthipeptide synthetase LanM family protein [Luteibacter sp. PPL201]|uniref:Type 2 lanthipeptide synthetase LanM family protein n=1 Tax=Luteibacter sahnii TaxID=3021977 RepID=A0ABT6BBJ2_9GAMM